MTTTQHGKLTREFIDRLYTRMHNGFTIDRYEFARAIEAEVEARTAKKMDALVKNAALGAAVRKLCDGGAFDLTDSPKSFMSNVKRLVAESAAHQQDTVAEKGEK